jgi:hypothetical protein
MLGKRQEPFESADLTQTLWRSIMSRYRVTCITKHEKYERILNLGCYSPANIFHTFPEDEVIRRIEGGHDTFYVERPSGHVAELEVAEHEGRKYVKTKPDGERPDNLLSLAQCSSKPHHVVTPIRTVVPAASHGTCQRRS